LFLGASSTRITIIKKYFHLRRGEKENINKKYLVEIFCEKKFKNRFDFGLCYEGLMSKGNFNKK
jgi:hypothetical protein